MPFGSILSGIGSIVGAIGGISSASKDRKLQQQFAQQGIRWKVADAKAAGVHPLYALGAPTISYQPQGAGGWDLLSQAGQDIGRAVDATRTQPERVDAYAKQLQALQLERAGLENLKLRNDMAMQNDAYRRATNPPAPAAVNQFLIPGQTGSGLGLRGSIEEKPMERTVSGEKLHQEPGAIPETGFTFTGTGWAPVPSYDAKQRIEDQIIPELLWSVRNNLIPSFSGEGAALRAPPDRYLKKGMEWYFNPWYQEYQQVPKKKKKGFIGPARGMPSVERR